MCRSLESKTEYLSPGAARMEISPLPSKRPCFLKVCKVDAVCWRRPSQFFAFRILTPWEFGKGLGDGSRAILILSTLGPLIKPNYFINM